MVELCDEGVLHPIYENLRQVHNAQWPKQLVYKESAIQAISHLCQVSKRNDTEVQ